MSETSNKPEYLIKFLQEKVDDLKNENAQYKTIFTMQERHISMLQEEIKTNDGYIKYQEKRLDESETTCKEWFEKYKAIKREFNDYMGAHPWKKRRDQDE